MLNEPQKKQGDLDTEAFPNNVNLFAIQPKNGDNPTSPFRKHQLKQHLFSYITCCS